MAENLIDGTPDANRKSTIQSRYFIFRIACSLDSTKYQGEAVALAKGTHDKLQQQPLNEGLRIFACAGSVAKNR